MSVQGFFDAQVFEWFPRVVEAINNASPFAANQMRCATLRAAYNLTKQDKLHIVEQRLLDKFEYNEWR